MANFGLKNKFRIANKYYLGYAGIFERTYNFYRDFRYIKNYTGNLLG
jgi:hypothetical protein